MAMESGKPRLRADTPRLFRKGVGTETPVPATGTRHPAPGFTSRSTGWNDPEKPKSSLMQTVWRLITISGIRPDNYDTGNGLSISRHPIVHRAGITHRSLRVESCAAVEVDGNHGQFCVVRVDACS